MKPGTYQHYKGGIYEVTGVARHTETEEELVVYTGEDGRIWVRPLAMFNETTTAATGETVPRFRSLEEKADETPPEIQEFQEGDLLLIVDVACIKDGAERWSNGETVEVRGVESGEDGDNRLDVWDADRFLSEYIYPHEFRGIQKLNRPQSDSADAGVDVKKEGNRMTHRIDDLPMTLRLKNCLRNHGVTYLEELYAYTDDDFFRVKNIGRKCIHEAHELVALYKQLDGTHEPAPKKSE